MHKALGHIQNWVFDLDNTLYPSSADLWPQIDALIGKYVRDLLQCGPDEAHRVHKEYFYTHGTTLNGLIADHGVDPHHYLDAVHAVDLSNLAPRPEMAAALARLPGRKLIFTNADVPYAQRVLEQLGLTDSFEAIHDIHATNYRPKPQEAAYQSLLDRMGIDPTQSLFVEDMARNLKPAKAIGMTTVWINNGSEQTDDPDRSFVDHTITDLSQWLNQILED